ncbi:hypothetical protein [Nesterenkonia pannonica]|uniref:hypothetical protein n=1 Tax=Nesterenkonia pannonica TaxID=1548602 RepID=UPI002164E77C|nr:hypothetical protein [Nesterenkonia pannonica]
MSREKSGLPQVLLVATVLVVAANLRPAISAVGPLLEQIRTDTGLSPSLLGLLGAIPVLSFGVISPSLRASPLGGDSNEASSPPCFSSPPWHCPQVPAARGAARR